MAFFVCARTFAQRFFAALAIFALPAYDSTRFLTLISSLLASCPKAFAGRLQAAQPKLQLTELFFHLFLFALNCRQYAHESSRHDLPQRKRYTNSCIFRILYSMRLPMLNIRLLAATCSIDLRVDLFISQRAPTVPSDNSGRREGMSGPTWARAPLVSRRAPSLAGGANAKGACLVSMSDDYFSGSVVWLQIRVGQKCVNPPGSECQEPIRRLSLPALVLRQAYAATHLVLTGGAYLICSKTLRPLKRSKLNCAFIITVSWRKKCPASLAELAFS
jgi:hypothetical protein